MLVRCCSVHVSSLLVTLEKVCVLDVVGLLELMNVISSLLAIVVENVGDTIVLVVVGWLVVMSLFSVSFVVCAFGASSSVNASMSGVVSRFCSGTVSFYWCV